MKHKKYQIGILCITIILLITNVIPSIRLSEPTGTTEGYWENSLYIQNSNGKIWIATGANLQTAITDEGDDGLIYLPPGIINITVANGISISNDNITIIGSNTILKKSENGEVGPVLEINGAKNITIRGVVFDQDRHNADHDDNGTTEGMQWVVRIIGGSENVLFENCHFINGEQNLIVTNNTDGLRFTDCVFNDCGEHPFYIYNSRNVNAIGCTVTNWAKTLRGYGPKVSACNDVNFFNCYFEQNKDGTGHATSGTYANYGAYMSVVTNSNNVKFSKCFWKGDNGMTTQQPCLQIDTGCNNTLYDGCTFDDVGRMSVVENNLITHYSEITDCVFNMTNTLYVDANTLPSVLSDCKFFNPFSFALSYDNVTIDNCKFINTSRNNNFTLFTVTGNNCEFLNCDFIDFSYRGIDLSSASGSTIDNCYFSNGYSSWAVKSGDESKITDNVFENDNTPGSYTIYGSGVNGTLRGNYFGTNLVLTDLITTNSSFSIINNNQGFMSVFPVSNISNVFNGFAYVDTDSLNIKLSNGNWLNLDNSVNGSADDLSDNTSTQLSDTADLLYETELDSEAELESQLVGVTDVYTDNDGSLDDDDLSDNDTDDLSEGVVNFYATLARIRSLITSTWLKMNNATFTNNITIAGRELNTADFNAWDAANSGNIVNGSIWNTEHNYFPATGAGLQAAIDDLTAGGTVVLPNGTITVSTDIELDDDISLIGAGVGSTTLFATAGVSQFVNIEDDDNVTIRDMTLDMDDVGNNCFRIVNSHYLRLEDLKILNAGYQGIVFYEEGSHHSFFNNINIRHSNAVAGHGVGVNHVNNSVFSNFICENYDTDVDASEDGFDVTDSYNSIFTNIIIKGQGWLDGIKIASSDVGIVGCIFSNFQIIDVNQKAMKIQDAQWCEFSNIKITGCDTVTLDENIYVPHHLTFNNIEIQDSEDEGFIFVDLSINNITMNNVFINNSAGKGIVILGKNIFLSNVVVQNSGNHNYIESGSSNVFIDLCSFSYGAGYGLHCNGVNHFTITNSLFENNGAGAGIATTLNACNNYTVMGCTFQGNAEGIDMHNDDDWVTLIGNTFIGDAVDQNAATIIPADPSTMNLGYNGI